MDLVKESFDRLEQSCLEIQTLINIMKAAIKSADAKEAREAKSNKLIR